MKLLLLAALLCPLWGTAQEIPKGADVITIKTTLSDSALTAKTVSILDDQGYIALTADTKLGRVVTEEKTTVGQFTMRILATAKQGILTLKGQWSLRSMNMINQPAEYKGMNGSIPKKMFTKLNEIAELLKVDVGATDVEYAVSAKK